MQIRLLGGVSAATSAGEPLDVGPAKCQALLAGLALSVGSAVPVSRLIDLVWGEAPPRTAEKTLQTYVTRLRKALGTGSIVRTGAAYRLDLPADTVDVARFQRHLSAGDTRAALAEWGGQPLAGLDPYGLSATVDGLMEQWLSATERELEHQVETDAPAAIIRLTELTGSYPFSEGLWALLMTALYRVGRQAEALAAYGTARRHLVTELGVEPGPRLRELESRILHQDEQLGVDPLRPDRHRHGNLPREAGRLIGREAELKAVGEALLDAPVVTLVGPGGIGKTRLALASARLAGPGFADGAWLVELASITAACDVARAAADALAELDVPDLPGRTLAESVTAALGDRRALVVLDNCEHVVDGAAELASAIAASCAEVRVLATSRESLGLASEQLFTLTPLDPSGAGVELFNERAQAVDPTFEPHLWPAEVTEICRVLEGVPLAIDLAAARVRSMSPPDLVERLDDRLRILAGSRRQAPERHRTLRATIKWSYDLLSPPEQDLFQQLSVFAGPFDLAATEAVTASAGRGLDVDLLLGDLVERSMVLVEPGYFGRRYRILDTMRQFGAEHLAAGDRAGPTAERHARWCLGEVDRIGGLLASHAEHEGVGRLVELWPNLRAAFDWACTTGDRRLAHGLLRPIAAEVYLRSQTEIGDWAERLLAMTPPDDDELVVFGLTWAARRYMRHLDREGFERLVARYGEPAHPLIRFARGFVYNDLATMTDAANQAVAELHRAGDDHAASLFELAGLGVTLLRSGELATHDDLVTALAGRFRAQGPPSCENWALTMLGYSASLQGRHDQAWQLFEQAAGVELPERTHSMVNPLEARQALRRGNQALAMRTLRAYVEKLLDQHDLYLTPVAGIEFVNMMTTIGHRPEASPVLGYLADSLYFDPSFLTVPLAGAPPGELDDRQALVYMRDVLDRLS